MIKQILHLSIGGFAKCPTRRIAAVVAKRIRLLTEDADISNIILTVLHFRIAEPISAQIIVTFTTRALISRRGRLVAPFEHSFDVSSVNQD